MGEAITDNHWRPRIPVRVQRQIEGIAERRGTSTTDVLRNVITRGLFSIYGMPLVPGVEADNPLAGIVGGQRDSASDT